MDLGQPILSKHETPLGVAMPSLVGLFFKSYRLTAQFDLKLWVIQFGLSMPHPAWPSLCV